MATVSESRMIMWPRLVFGRSLTTISWSIDVTCREMAPWRHRTRGRPSGGRDTRRVGSPSSRGRSMATRSGHPRCTSTMSGRKDRPTSSVLTPMALSRAIEVAECERRPGSSACSDRPSWVMSIRRRPATWGVDTEVLAETVPFVSRCGRQGSGSSTRCIGCSACGALISLSLSVGASLTLPVHRGRSP